MILRTEASGSRRGDARPSPDWPARRADARRNHERVLAAAIEVFTEHGLDATIPQVAERAGVGKATVYRSYPTKADLVHALAQLHVDWLRRLIADAADAADTDARQALETMLHQITDRVSRDRLMVETLNTADGIGDETTVRLLEHILTKGRQQGVLRDDVAMMDIQVLVSGFAHALLELGITDPAVWRRYATLTLTALRP